MGRNSEFEGTGPSAGGPGGDDAVDPATLAGGGSADADGFDPNIHIGRDRINADGTFKRKRGRKAGSGNSAKAGPINLNGLEAILVSMHTMMAAATSSPELVLDKDEASAITAAIAGVAEQYPMTIDPKALAWANLVMAATMVYGPRVYLIRERKNKERRAEEKKPPISDNLSVLYPAS